MGANFPPDRFQITSKERYTSWSCASTTKSLSQSLSHSASPPAPTPHTRHPVSPHTNTPYSHRKPSLDLRLKAASVPTPLNSAESPPHSPGTLYPTEAWSLVDTWSPTLADLVAWPWTSPTRRSILAWFSGSCPCQKRHAWTLNCCLYRSPTFNMENWARRGSAWYRPLLPATRPANRF